MIQVCVLKSNEIDQFMPLWILQGEYHYALDPIYYKKADSSEEYIEQAILSDNPHILIAKDNGKIVGFMTMTEGQADYFDTKIEKYGEILELFVSSEARNKGIGRLLIAAAEKYFAEKGIKWVKLYCSSFNSGALALYDKIGFIDRQRVLFKEVK